MRAPRRCMPRPQEAMQAPPEEFLYLACLHEGTGVEAPDFLAVVDAEDGRDRPRDADAQRRRRAAPLRLEPLQLGLPRARPLAPDRARASAPRASTSSTSPTTRAAPRIEKVIERDELVAKTGYTRPHTVHCMPGDNIVDQHARRRRRQRRRRLRRARRADVRGQGPLGERRRARRRSTTTSGTSRARTCSSPPSSASPTPTSTASTSTTSRRAATASRLHFWNLAERTLEQTHRPRRRAGWCRSRCAGCTTPTPTRASSAPRCRARSGASTATNGALAAPSR